jgi:4-amino-4-deoxy-L-arabinose transferase-like glycosyltransferase
VAPAAAGIGAVLTVPRGERKGRFLPAAAGAALAILLVLAWAIPVDLRTDGGIFRVALGHHVVGRAGGGVAGLGGFEPWWFLFYVPAVLISFFPWSAWLPTAFRAWRSFGLASRDRTFLGWWIAGTFLLFTVVVGKRPHYVLPMFPALAVLTGGALSGPGWRPGRFGTLLLVSVSALAAVGLPAVVAAKDLPGALLPAVGIGAILLVLAAGVAGLRRDRSAERTVGLTVLAVGTAFAILLLWLLPAVEHQRLVPRVGAGLARVAPPGTERVVMDWDPDGLLFYSQRDERGELTTKRTVIPQRVRLGKPLLSLLRSGRKVAVVVTQERRDRILEVQSLSELPARLVMRCRGYDAKQNEWRTVLLYVTP